MLSQVAVVGGLTQRYSFILGSPLVPILLSKKANLSLTFKMAALVKAFSILLIQISMLALSKVGRSGFLVNADTSLTWSCITVLTASGSMAPTELTEAEMAADVEARRVSWTRALIASASIAAAG